MQGKDNDVRERETNPHNEGDVLSSPAVHQVLENTHVGGQTDTSTDQSHGLCALGVQEEVT